MFILNSIETCAAKHVQTETGRNKLFEISQKKFQQMKI